MVMQNRNIIITFVILFVALTKVQGQEHLPQFTGIVADKANKAIKGAVCKLKNEKDSIISYAFTNAKGEYKLPFNKEGEMIEVSHLSYEIQTIILRPDHFRYDVTLADKANELKEVVVSVAPISRSKDTLNYNVVAFRKQEDVSIEDVIRRLPGIEVATSGEITYQGKSINKLNIEGLDLMGDKYNQATQNMPAEAVSQIQVMENNQPVRVLDGKINNNHATLNIKLKKGYKLRPFGELESGAGNHHIWEGSATAIEVSPHNQWLVTGTMDNRGISLSALTREMANYDRMYTNEPLPESILSASSYNTLPISPLYFLKNKSYFAGINYLHAFNKYANMRVNLLYNHEDEMRTDSLFSQYVAADTITTFQKQSLNGETDVLKGQIRYELNAPKLYLEDILTGESSWMKTENRYHTNIAGIEEGIKVRPMFLQNVLNAHFNIGSQTLTLSSIARTYRTKETLGVLYGEEGEERQRTKTTSFFLRNRVGTAFSLWGNSLSLAFISEHKRNKLSIFEQNKDNASHYWLNTFEPSYTMNLNRAELILSFPMEHINYNVWGKAQSKFLIAPSVDLNWKLTPSLTANINIGYNQDASTTNIMYNGVVGNNYRMFTVGLDSLSVNKSFISNCRLSYLDTSRLLSMNFFMGWVRQNRDYLVEYLYAENLTLASPKWKENVATMFSAAYDIKKIFRNEGLSLKYSVSYADNGQDISQNGMEGKVRFHALSNTIKLEWNKLQWIHTSATAGTNVRWKERDSFSDSHNLLKDFNYTLKLDLFPIQKLQVYMDFSQIYREIVHSNYATVSFLNAGLKYMLSRKIQLKASAINLLNNKTYIESAYNGVNYTYYDIALRGMEMLLSFNLRF